MAHGPMGRSYMIPPLIEVSKNVRMLESDAKTIIKKLIIHKADINAREPYYENTPLINTIFHQQSQSIAQLLILAGADVTLKNRDGLTVFDMTITTPLTREALLKVCSINKQAFHQLDIIEKTIHAAMLENLTMPIEELVSAFHDSIPYYTDQGESQPGYDLLNERITEHFTLIKEKLEIIRLLNQPTYLPVKNVAAIAAEYLFAEQK